MGDHEEVALLRTSRAAVLTLATGGALWLLAAPALAHVEVSAKPAQAGAANAVVTFEAEGESTTSGITGVRIQLPAGLTADQVKLAGAPSGWKLTAASGVVTISGPALKASEDAEYSVRIGKLPDARQLVFKTIVNYSDGHKDSWIEEGTGGESEPDNPAPVLRLAAAAPTTAAPTTAAPTTAPTTTPPAPTTAAPTAAATTAAAPVSDDGDGGSTALGVVVGIVAVLAVAGGVLYVLRRRAAS